MGKYIRTKDGVYEINGYYEPRDYYWAKDCEEPIGSDEVIKQADIIGELCDSWVIVPIGVFFNGVPFNSFVRNIGDNIQHFINDSHIIYGAIWIKGEHNEPILKSVAKMINNKGDLKLL